MPSYKASGGNKAKLLWKLHRSTMGDVLVFGCSQIRQGERGGGFVLWGAYSWVKFGMWGDLIPWPNHDEQAELDHLSRWKKSTIPQSTVGCFIGQQIGRGTERQLCLRRRITIENIRRLRGGGQAWSIGNLAPISMGTPRRNP